MLHLDVNEADASIQAIASSKNPLDIINQAMVTTEQQREAYESLQHFLDKDEYKPHKFGLVKETTKSGITKWIMNDQDVIKSFHDHDGRPRRKIWNTVKDKEEKTGIQVYLFITFFIFQLWSIL